MSKCKLGIRKAKRYFINFFLTDKKQMGMKQLKFNDTILVTTNYNLFKSIDGNRTLNPLHVKRIKQSMATNPLLTLIMVNEKFEIIDGQHRFEASKELGLPIYYVKVYGYGMNEVHVLNANHSNWKKSDFVDGYADSGNENYIIFQSFSAQYSELTFSSIHKLLSGKRKGDPETQSGTTRDFQRGLFKVKNLKNAHVVASKIMDYKAYFPKFNDNMFVVTLLHILEHPNYNHDEMMSKLKLQPTALDKCGTQTQYALLLEDIYNFKRKTKVSLRY